MKISTHPNSLLDSRWTSGRQLTESLGRPPTRAELSQHWGTTEARVHSILLTLTARGAEIPITPKSPSPARMDKKAVRLAEIENLTKINGRPPTRRELSELWGVNRSRVGRVLHQLAHDQAKSRANLALATSAPWLKSP
jgi:DNA-directed RNA polymerase specialized sigma subunit